MSAWDRSKGDYERELEKPNHVPGEYDPIGSYVTRESGDGLQRPLTLPHLVESVIDDEPVTRCGRRLRQREGTTFRYEAVPARRVCKRCQP